jgi:transposase
MTLDTMELLRRLRAGETDRAIARDLGMARKTAARYRDLARDLGYLAGPLPALIDLDRMLGARVSQDNLPRQPFKAEPWRAVVETLRGRGVEMMAVFQRLRDDHGYPGSYSALRRFVQHLEGRTPEGFVRLEVGPGEEAQVDFGYAGEMIDPVTGALRRAWAFVMTLSYSRHQYVTFVFDQKIATWLACHREAFAHFGGVPRKIVVDNLKAAIVKAVLHEPVAQRSYREFAMHYDFLISPCRPRAPRHKGKVESGVKYVKGNFLAGRAPGDLVREREAVLDWIERIAGVRVHGTTQERPLARFLEAEKTALRPLPATAYDMGVWKKAKLHPDCHVVVDGAFYSAPHRLISQRLWVRTNGREVEIYHDYERVATHAWGPPGTRRTIEAHYPPSKVAFLLATPRVCRERAEKVGPATAELVERLLGERPLDRLRGVQAVIRLADKHGAQRLEAACRRALAFDETSPVTVKRILARGLESEPVSDAPAPRPSRAYAFARPGSEIFGRSDHGHEIPARPQAQGVAAVGDPADARDPEPAGDRAEDGLRGVPRAALGG